MRITGKLVIKNSGFNLVGQGLPSIVAVIALPFLIHWLGEERFGLFMLIWAIQGFMQFLSLRLGVALVKFAAEAIGKGEEGRLVYLTWTTTVLLGCLGGIGGLALGIFALFLFTQIFQIPLQLWSEAKIALFLTALSVPFSIVSVGFKALLQAFQRFDLVNLVHGAGGCLRYLIALGLAGMGFHLPPIMLALLLIDALRLAIYLLLCFKVYPAIKSIVVNIKDAKPLLWFGGWLSVSQIVGMTTQYLDRFVVGWLLPVGHLTYYATPVEIVNRLGMLSQSVNQALFPSLSALGKDERAFQLYAQAMKFMLIIVAPIAFFLAFFAQDILRLYLGEHLALKVAPVFQFLVIGFLIGSLGSVVHNYVLALGYPNAVAKFHLVELPLYAGLAFWLTSILGVQGMALAWLIRRILETGYVFFVLQQAAPQNIRALISYGMGRAIIITVTLALFIATASWAIHAGSLVWITVSMSMIAYGILVWSKVLSHAERKGLVSMIREMRVNIIPKGVDTQ